jgi:hypothetical protein
MCDQWRIRLSQLLVVVAVAAVGAVAAVPSNASARPSGSECSAQVDRAAEAITNGRKISLAAMKTLHDCLLSQPGAIAASIDEAQAVTGNVAAAATVVASFQNSLLCLDFNSDGTISSTNPTWHVLSGGYIGIPGIFTIFSYTGSFYLGGFSSFGLTIGPFSLEFFSIAGVIGGTQVPSCPAL